jgi:hypothetical protein
VKETMKKSGYILIVIQFVILTGCSQMFYDNYQRYDDEFKNNTKIISRVLLRPVERRTEISGAYIIFEREFSSSSDVTKAYLVVSRTMSSFKIENKGFMKVADQSFELDISNTVSEYRSKSETSVSSYAKVDSTGVHTGQTTDIDESKWIDDKFMFTLTDDMKTRIPYTDAILLRFYFGPVPATFRITGSKLRPVRKMFSE